MDHRLDGDFSFLEGRNDIPELVKTASDAEPTLFAYHDGMRSFFPIDTPANAWLSAAFFEKNAGELPKNVVFDISQAISGGLAFHGIDYQPMVKIAEVDDSLVKLASQIIDFEQKHKTVHPRERVAKARKIMNDVASMRHHFEGTNHEIPESLSRYGGTHLHEHWREPVLSRLRLTASPEARKAYNSILTDKNTENTPVSELADLLEYLDKKYGLHQHWDRQIHDPFYSVQSCVPRKAVKIIVMSVGGKDFTDSDMARLDRGSLGQHFSEDAIDGIFNSSDKHGLPDVVKKVLAEILSR